MTIINTSPDRPIQLGYEGEDRVTVVYVDYTSALTAIGGGS